MAEPPWASARGVLHPLGSQAGGERREGGGGLHKISRGQKSSTPLSSPLFPAGEGRREDVAVPGAAYISVMRLLILPWSVGGIGLTFESAAGTAVLGADGTASPNKA